MNQSRFLEAWLNISWTIPSKVTQHPIEMEKQTKLILNLLGAYFWKGCSLNKNRAHLGISYFVVSKIVQNSRFKT